MNQIPSIFVLGVLLNLIAFGQVAPRSRAGHHTEAPAAFSSAEDSSAPAPRRLYEHDRSFYEFVLHQLNPNDTDWGGWFEERRAAIIDSALHDPCFWYCLGLTVALFFTFAALLKSQSDQERASDITDERMEEVRKFAADSYQAALEAIDKYNTHIELCNRAIEAGEGRQAAAGAGASQATQAQTNPAKTQEETELEKRDKTRRESEESHPRTTAPARSNGGAAPPGNKVGSNGQGKESPDPLTPSYNDLVHQINILQQQLFAEKDKNKRLKGGA